MIAIISYTNFEYFPPVLNALDILLKFSRISLYIRRYGSEEFTASGLKICRIGGKRDINNLLKQKSLFNFIEYLNFILTVLSGLFKERPLVIICYDPYAYIAGWIYKVILGKKVLLCYHSHESLAGYRKTKVFSLGYWVEKFGLQHLDKADWLSEADKKRAEAVKKISGCSRRVDVIRNFSGQTIDHGSDAGIKEVLNKYKENGKLIVLFPGTIGQNYLLENFLSSFKTDWENIVFCMCGVIIGAEFQERIKEYSSKYKNIVYLGFLTRVQLQACYDCVDIGAIFYNFDNGVNWIHSAGACTKAGEYIKNGIPFVYPEFWNYETYYKRIGISYNPDSFDSFKKSLQELIAKEELRKNLSANEKTLFKEGLNFEKEFEPLLKIILSRINKNNP